MKKPIHFFLFAIIAIIVSSCSKSGQDLAANEQPAKKVVSLPKSGKFANSPFNIAQGHIEFLNFINQPYLLKLGHSDAYLMHGETAVFYLILSDEVANATIENPMLTTINFENEKVVGSYTLYPSQDAEVYKINVPEELSNANFMFAIVNLQDGYEEKMEISLHSEITVNGDIQVADLQQAFIVLMDQ